MRLARNLTDKMLFEIINRNLLVVSLSTIYVSEVYVAHILSKILGRIYTSPGFKGLKTIVDVYVELLPMKHAFPTTTSFVIAAITILVS